DRALAHVTRPPWLGAFAHGTRCAPVTVPRCLPMTVLHKNTYMHTYTYYIYHATKSAHPMLSPGHADERGAPGCRMARLRIFSTGHPRIISGMVHLLILNRSRSPEFRHLSHPGACCQGRCIFLAQ